MPPKKTKKTAGKRHSAAAAAPPSQDDTAATEQVSTRAHWTTADETELIDFILDHKAEGGDGLNFKAATWTAAAKLLDTQRTKGGIKTSLACKNKFANVRRQPLFLSYFRSQIYILQLKELYLVVDALKQVSGFTWDDEYGADINSDNLAIWDTYVEVSTVPRPLFAIKIDEKHPEEVPKGHQVQKKGLAAL
jgi:hypothetical protein